MLLGYYQWGIIEAGCDEAGRGCLAGPVVAAAVILPADYTHEDLNDSKLLTPEQRVVLREEILARAIDYGIGMVDNEEIDRINILKASFKAMHIALNQLKKKPQLILVDGNRFEPYPGIENVCIIKGDSLYNPIAAASILAKTCRDELMRQYAEEFPDYHWHTNVGYPTLQHRQAIREFGLTKLHRKSFRQLPEQLELF
ncbi:MAG: ribonuclease HII [Cyclobacteriaceae bacterium]|nr:ribonuclease HII [Cyclobacteriaceae bacterium]